MTNPFPPSTRTTGQGSMLLTPTSRTTSSLERVSYTYPLKLIAPVSHLTPSSISAQIVYLLTYGGGIVAGDTLDLRATLGPGTRLVLLTQGSTKVYKAPATASAPSRQHVRVQVGRGALLTFLPDPVQPFERSWLSQRQRFDVHSQGSAVVLDWVCRGRAARGENWDCRSYVSRNDVWAVSEDGVQQRLLVRDNLVLSEGEQGGFRERMHGLGVYGTLFLYGPLVQGLAAFFGREFAAITRIGARKWDSVEGEEEGEKKGEVEVWREQRQSQERRDGLLWTVATLRGCTVVKFGALEVEGGKRWLRAMIEAEGSVVQVAGEQALMCLR